MKRCVLFSISILMWMFSFAQESEVNPEWRSNGDLDFGLYVGFTTSSLSLDQNIGGSDDVSGNSFLVGGQLDYYFKNNWSVKGKFSYEDRNYGGGGLNFICATISPVWHFGRNRRWHLHLGAAYSANLDSSSFDKSGAFGTDIGIGVIIPIKSMQFFIELDGVTEANLFEVNLTDLNGNPIGTESLQSNRSTINVGILF